MLYRQFEGGDRCLGTATHSEFPFLLETPKTNRETAPKKPPSSGGFTFPRTSSQRVERIYSIPPSHPGPQLLESTFPCAGLERPKLLLSTAPWRVMG